MYYSWELKKLFSYKIEPFKIKKKGALKDLNCCEVGYRVEETVKSCCVAKDLKL